MYIIVNGYGPFVCPQILDCCTWFLRSINITMFPVYLWRYFGDAPFCFHLVSDDFYLLHLDYLLITPVHLPSLPVYTWQSIITCCDLWHFSIMSWLNIARSTPSMVRGLYDNGFLQNCPFILTEAAVVLFCNIHVYV